MAGTRSTSIRTYRLYYEGVTPATNLFAGLEIPYVDQADATPFLSQGFILANDNAALGADVQISFDGVNLDGTIKAQEALGLDFNKNRTMFIRSTGASPIRLWVW